MIDNQILGALTSAESILSILHWRGIVDSEWNREDVKRALYDVEKAITVIAKQEEDK